MIQWVAIRITCKKLVPEVLLKTKLFLQFQIDQQRVETPMRILALETLSMPFSQLTNMFAILYIVKT